ncbi:hypothetical protein [Mangrovicoccus ximenensis]|uniref:hypothetical protein n=1 Tax=Mangrovicoccus ximenensis TaxID=1911570 RepID=UPI00137536CA|nr:hypothetical protein [Mangrovicoccus ximenensis]
MPLGNFHHIRDTTFTAEFKEQAVARLSEPGASPAGAALEIVGLPGTHSLRARSPMRR